MSKQDTFLIQCVNKLHDVFSDLGVNAQFDLPQIAVVGSQSAGKSSVLENFVGWNFLPRGSGIVTRCPLILQMLTGPEKYGEFSHTEKKFTDFDEIRAEIEKRTDEVSGDNKGISEDPINLKIYSPDFLNLTLVDLPGLTRNPTGSQPADIEQQLEEMIIEYIEKDSCLILAVSPANTDLANSDALKLARRVDPDGKRTIGVLTKLDIMDTGTNARDILLGKTFALPRGYVGVVSRSQSEINAGKNIEKALKKEKAFFENHKSYQDLAHRMGTAFLQRKLNCDLGKHIHEKLPEFRDKILEKKRDAEKTLRRCQKLDLRNGGSNALHKIVQELTVRTAKCIKGTAEVIPEKQQIGTKIHYLFHEKLEDDYWADEVDEQKIYDDIATAIKTMQGIQPNLYASDEVMTEITKNEIMGKRDAMDKCLEEVVQELRQFFGVIVDEIVARCYRSLAVKVKDVIFGQLTRCAENCEKNLEQILHEESSYINIKHADFLNSDQLPNNEILQAGTLSYDKKEYWCVLTSNIISMYDVPAKSSADVYHTSCRIIDTNENAHKFSLESQVGSHKQNKYIEAPNRSKFNAWKDAFINAGVLGIKIEHQSDVDFQMENQIKLIRKHLGLHMRIFTKKYLDTVPKKIAYHVVEEIIGYVNDKLFDVLASGDLIGLLDENPQHKEIRERATAELEACKQALQIIDEQDAKLTSE